VTFIQIVEYFTGEPHDTFASIADQWQHATDGKRPVHQAFIGRDRDDPIRHYIIAVFDSQESATHNSALPETNTFAEKLTELAVKPLEFRNVDVLETREL
jgi:quinol monooxygenase YgiN